MNPITKILGLAALSLALFVSAPTAKAGQCLNNLIFTPATNACDGTFAYQIDLPPGASFTTNSLGQTVLPDTWSTSTNACVGTQGGNIVITITGNTNCCDGPRYAGLLTWHNVVQNLDYAFAFYIPNHAYGALFNLYYTGVHCDTEGVAGKLCGIAGCNFGGED